MSKKEYETKDMKPQGARDRKDSRDDRTAKLIENAKAARSGGYITKDVRK